MRLLMLTGLLVCVGGLTASYIGSQEASLRLRTDALRLVAASRCYCDTRRLSTEPSAARMHNGRMQDATSVPPTLFIEGRVDHLGESKRKKHKDPW